MDGKQLPHIIRELVEHGHEPYTVTKHVHLTADIADAQYIFVTPAAAEIYGIESPDKLVGSYLSQTLMPQDYMRGVLYAIARHHRIQVKAPAAYATRIVRSDNEIVGVRKQTIQLRGLDGVTYWITKLKMVKELDEPTPVDAEKLKLTPQMVYDWAGIASVADAQKLVHLVQTLPKGGLTETEITSNVLNEYLSKSNELLVPHMQFVSKSGKVRKLRACIKCGYPWFSGGKRPRSCPSCRDNNWDKEYVVGPRAKEESDSWEAILPSSQDD